MSLLFVAAGLDGKPQATVWALALVIDLLGAYVGGGRGWRLAAGHFAERHALIVIPSTRALWFLGWRAERAA